MALEQDVSARDEVSVFQSVVLEKCRRRGQSACWYRQTLLAVFGSPKMEMEKPAKTGEWSEFPTGENTRVYRRVEVGDDYVEHGRASFWRGDVLIKAKNISSMN